MRTKSSSPSVPRLPPIDPRPDAKEHEHREFQLSLARTAYNYVRSYPNLESVPLSAGVPAAEAFTVDYNLLVARTIAQLSENFLEALSELVRSELNADSPVAEVQRLLKVYEETIPNLSAGHPIKDVELLRTFLEKLSRSVPVLVESMTNLPLDITKVIGGLEAATEASLREGPTAFLKSLVFDMLALVNIDGKNYLAGKSSAAFEKLVVTLPTPAMLDIKQAPWMPKKGPGEQNKPCQQDWFFGYLQVAGFNTTNLRAVTKEVGADAQAISLAHLLTKMPGIDKVFADVLGERDMSLEKATGLGRVFVVDYAALAPPVQGSTLHGLPRYVPAPIALFYWNPAPPDGYPPSGYGDSKRPGVLQPIAIQLAQTPDPDAAPIYTPKRSKTLDPTGHKWLVAKLLVNVACAIQHESVAHLGDCHLIIEPIVLATHRQLAEVHPLYTLLWPHFRFTLPINDGAIHNLVIPGGVVAANVAPAMASTLNMIDDAHRAWRWDDNKPSRLFARRGVNGSNIVFPFRDDTLELWEAIRKFVASYLKVYYPNDEIVSGDMELQAWIGELTAADRAGFQGMEGLTKGKDGKLRIDSFDYLVDVVAQIIYTAGPLHASVNYAQYALGSYAPAVAASSYGAPPRASDKVDSDEDFLNWCLPLDVALYTISFEYLLSAVQYDRLGHYDADPRNPYFVDARVHDAVAEFQEELAKIETKIRQRNQTRPLPYPFQLPSQVPNSISI